MNTLWIKNDTMPIVCGANKMAASTEFTHADRTLDFQDAVYVTRGCIYVAEEDPEDGGVSEYAVNPTNLLFLKAGCHHYGTDTCPKGTEWYYIHFLMDCNYRENLPVLTRDRQFHADYDTLQYQLPLPKICSLSQDDFCIRQMIAVTDAYQKMDAMGSWEINRLAAEFLQSLAYTSGTSGQTSLSDQIARYLEVHLEDPFSASALEAYFYLSYKHMASVFKEEKGQTMQQFHTSLRMASACRLLRSTTWSIGRIAAETGYDDPLYFSRIFHRTLGMSPSQYRQAGSAWY